MVWPIMGASGGGGRSSVKGFDMSDPNSPVDVSIIIGHDFVLPS